MGTIRTLIVFAAFAAACGSDDVSEPESPCKAFLKEAEPTLFTTMRWPEATRRAFTISNDRIVTFAGHEFRDGGRVVLDVSPLPDAAIIDVTLAPDASRAFVLFKGVTTGANPVDEYRVVRFVSGDGGATFGPVKDMIEVSIGPTNASALYPGALAAHKDGTLFVALGDRTPSEAQDPSSLLGKVLRLDVSGDRATPVPEVPPNIPRREVWSLGVSYPRGLSIDHETGDVWLADRRGVADELHRVLPRRNYGWPVRDVVGDFAIPVATLEGAHVMAQPGAVVRDPTLGAISGAYVYASATALVAVSPHGPSGTAELVDLAGAPSGRVEPGNRGEFLVLATPVVGVAGDQGTIPRSLAQTGCFDFNAPNGAPLGATSFDIATPLWSDGAEKGRFVVVPKGKTARVRSDGDIEFPPGTVAVKTFSFGGRKIETRLFVQHEMDDWVGYSYAWNDEGTDAQLVSGNRVVDLVSGGEWYFPSRTDCNACHTAAAGFTLGPEARQTGAAPFEKIAPGLMDAPRFDPKDARAYLHANCSTCHRGGSVTGKCELDLRFDKPLGETGLCSDPRVSTLGITGAKIVAPGDPDKSVLVKRMKALDDTRMPKLATRVVDTQGVATLEAWVRSLTSCP